MRISDLSSDVCSSDLVTSSLAAGAKLDQVKALYADTPFADVELDGMRRTIARRLVESKQTVPHFYLSTDIDIQRMLELRQWVNDSGSIQITVHEYVVQAYAEYLMIGRATVREHV